MPQPKITVTLANNDRLGDQPGSVFSYPNERIGAYQYDAKLGKNLCRMPLETFLKHAQGMARLSHQFGRLWYVVKVEAAEPEANENELLLMERIEELQQQLAATRSALVAKSEVIRHVQRMETTITIDPPPPVPPEEIMVAVKPEPEPEEEITPENVTRKRTEAMRFRDLRMLALSWRIPSRRFEQITKTAGLIDVILEFAAEQKTKLATA